MIPHKEEQMHILKKRYLTLRKSQLNSLGVYDVIIKDKRTLKSTNNKSRNRTLLLYLEVPGTGYKDIVTVGVKEFYSAVIGKSIGKRVVLVNPKSPSFYIIGKSDNIEKAIKLETRETKVFIVVIAIILPLFLHSLILFSTLIGSFF